MTKIEYVTLNEVPSRKNWAICNGIIYYLAGSLHAVHVGHGRGIEPTFLSSNDGHKPEIYNYLWMLMTKGDPTVFQESMEAFVDFCEGNSQILSPTLRTTIQSQVGISFPNTV